MPKNLYRLWADIRHQFRNPSVRGSIEANTSAKGIFGENLRRILQFDISGPFGATQRENPCNFDEVYRRLNDKKSSLCDSWRRKDIRKFRDNLELPKPGYYPSLETIDKAKNILIEGDSCADCKRRRINVLNSTSLLRRCLSGRYFTKGGKAEGIVFGIYVGDQIQWREIVLAMRRPELYLSFPIEIIHRQSGFHDNAGYFEFPLKSKWDVRDCLRSDYLLCALDFLAETEGCRLDFVFFPVKKGVIHCPDNGWVSYLRVYFIENTYGYVKTTSETDSSILYFSLKCMVFN